MMKKSTCILSIPTLWLLSSAKRHCQNPILIPNLILNLNPIPEFLRMRWGQRMMS